MLKQSRAIFLLLACAALGAGEEPNLVRSPDLQDRSHWRIKAGEEELFQSVQDGVQRVIRVNSPGRYCTFNQELKLIPNARYRLSAEVRASGTMGIRVRALQADQKKGQTAQAFELQIVPSADYTPYAVRFPAGPSGAGMLILGVTETSGTGAFFIRNLRVVRDFAPESTGRAIPIKADGEPVVVTKLMVTDCRALRGFIGAPVDGSLKSARWDGGTWEYNTPRAGAGVGYAWRNSDGLHITFADGAGFDAAVIRGGEKAKLYRDCSKYDDPKSGALIFEFPGGTENSRAFFDERVKTQRVSFFDVGDGHIADCSFYRVSHAAGVPGTPQIGVIVADRFIEQPIHKWEERDNQVRDLLDTNIRLVKRHMAERFPDAAKEMVFVYARSADHAPNPFAEIHVPAGQWIHFVGGAFNAEAPITAVGVSTEIKCAQQIRAIPFTVRVQDPLNPRLELHGADYVLDKPGRMRLICDFPNQIVPEWNRIWITLKFDVPVTLVKPQLELYALPREQAQPQALAHRKFLLKSFFAAMSEARPWNGFYKKEDMDKFFAKGDAYGPWVREILETIEQCCALDPNGKDDIVSQYHDWVYRHILRKSKTGMPPFATRYDKLDGVPEWAVLAHQAWMQSREVAKWWIENRMTPNGELGGQVGDDTDMYQNYAMLPMFERDGVGGLVLDAGARLAETAEQSTLELGLNKHTTDPLHAYEEGLNHEALMLWWFYGDPVYTERCMIAARSTEALTVLTPKGHRHFKSQECGAADLRLNRKTDTDGDLHPLMWHPTMEIAWYTRNPKAIKMLREWADGWLEHNQPGKYATSVDVASEAVTASSDKPLIGGYGSQGCVHTALAGMTGDAKYVQPFLEFLAAGKNDQYARRHIPELMQMGLFNVPEEKCKEAIGSSWPAQLYLRGNKGPLIAALKPDIEELQRFKHMHTAVECFTDRVFLYALINPSIAYTGGFATRNKLNHHFAVSWDGFGTDYAALVTEASKSSLKVLLCNLSDKPLKGRARVWQLEHGEYAMTFGKEAGEPPAPQTLELARCSDIEIALPARGVYVLELKQTKALDDVLARADLALSPLEVKAAGGKVTGKAHNIGAKDVEDVVVALLDDKGAVIVRKNLGKLEAPLDLTPRSVAFELEGMPPDAKGWSVMLDPNNKLPEIYEGNNRVILER